MWHDVITQEKWRVMTKKITHRCPRCGGPIPDAAHEGEFPGALSRTDNATEICSSCGTEEAMEQFYGQGLRSQEEWIHRS